MLSLSRMPLKTVHVCDVPILDHQVTETTTSLAVCSSSFARCLMKDDEDGNGRESNGNAFKFSKFGVMGHRGSGMNLLHCCDRRMKSIKENSILSFTSAAKLPLDFVEFDVQVTKDDCPVIFHDNFILTQDMDAIIEKRVTDLTSAELFCYGPQKEVGDEGKPLFRKTKDGRILEWKVEEDAPMCTLQEAFQKVDESIGFNIELKFDDLVVYREKELIHALQVILQVVFEYAEKRPVIFSSFQPDAALLIRKLQGTYPVFFLTNGGSQIYMDIRRNSLGEAIRLCIEGGLQGIVSEVKAILRNQAAVTRIKESNLSLVTYGQLNNMPEVVHMQHVMGVDGVIVDLVGEIIEAVSVFAGYNKGIEGLSMFWENGNLGPEIRPQFLIDELCSVVELIPELIQVSSQETMTYLKEFT